MQKEEIFQLVIHHTRDLFPELSGYAFLYNEDFRQFGASSIDRAVIITDTLEALSLNMPMSELFEVQSLAELVEKIYSRHVAAIC
jgi:polyketide biosynthesis acyl carrier protein